jgi:tetratricopeptide (TPR) repeat protein
MNKDAVAAENAYRQAYLLDASSRDWKLGLAQALMAQEKFAEAASLLDTLIAANANDKQLWLQQTNAYLAMERKDEAAVNLEILRHKGLADESNLNLLGNLYMDRGEPQLALYAYLAAIDKADTLDVGRALKSARILNDYGFPDKAAEFLVKIRAKLGDTPSKPDETALLLTEVRVAQSKNETSRVGEILSHLLELDPVNGEVLLEMARHLAQQAMDESDEEKRGALVQEARTNYQLAVRNEAVAYQANLGLGQMLVRERRYTEAMPVLEAALTLKKSESLEQYVNRVRRAADRQKQKLEREAEK